MNKKLISGFVAGVGMFALAATGQAQDKPSSPSSKPDAPMDSKCGAAKKASGEVTSVDSKTGKLMVKTATEELNLDASTAKKSLANIKVGDKVNVSYQDKGGMLVANSVNKASGSSKDGMTPSSSKDNRVPSTKSK
jgi:Cu/Ag efflux protein CusF